MSASPVDSPACSPLTRRNFLRFASALPALASIPIVTEAHLAMAQSAFPAPKTSWDTPDTNIHIEANENPYGPSEAARKAMVEMIPRGGRYEYALEFQFAALFAKQHDLDPAYVRAYAGSSEPLSYSVLTFCSKDRPLITADVSYEAGWWTAEPAGIPILRVPLADPKGKAAHDVHAMLAASPTPGLIYICNPNNPTGTVTPRQDLEYIANNLPKGAVLMIDEAYIHFSDEPTSIDFVKQGKDVIVLRTFSKIYGLAGIRMGIVIGRPDLLKRLGIYAQNALPITALAAARASLLDADLVPHRKQVNAAVRKETIDWLETRGYRCTPSQSNFFQVDTGRPGGEIIAALGQKGIFIGRVWKAWPTYVRVTVGKAEEMLAFREAFHAAMQSKTAGLTPLPSPLRNSASPHLS